MAVLLQPEALGAHWLVVDRWRHMLPVVVMVLIYPQKYYIVQKN